MLRLEIEHVAMMLNWSEKWVDVFYNKETKEIFQSQNGGRTIDVLIEKADTKWDAMVYLEEEFGSNVELD